MPSASGANVELSYVRESVHGVTPASPTMKTLRVTGRNINRTRGVLRSAERRGDRQRGDTRLGFHQVVGTLGFQLGVGDFDIPIIEGVMANPLVSVSTGSTSLASASGAYSRPAGSFITDGFSLGDEITVTGFAGAENNGRSRITALAADTIGVNKVGMTTEVAATGRTLESVGRIAKVGSNLYTHTVERRFRDLGRYQIFRGVAMNGVTLNFSPEAIINGTADVIGMTGTGYDTVTFGDPDPPSANPPFDAFTGALYEGGTEIGLVTALALTINNNRALSPVLFKRGSPDVYEGTAEIAGQLTVQFDDPAIVAKFEEETESSIDVRLDDIYGTNFHRIRLPRVLYLGDPIDPPPNGPVVVTMPFEAQVDGVTGTSMIWQVSNTTVP
jgi:hypothetical protein